MIKCKTCKHSKWMKNQIYLACTLHHYFPCERMHDVENCEDYEEYEKNDT